jgi:hypothetical protein
VSKLVFGVSRIIAQDQEKAANYNLPLTTFAAAYDELRRVCPSGDIHIHLFVEADSAAEVGAVLHDHNCGNMGGGCDCGAESRRVTK